MGFYNTALEQLFHSDLFNIIFPFPVEYIGSCYYRMLSFLVLMNNY